MTFSSAQTLKMTGTDDLPTDNARVFADIMEHETGSGVKTQTGEYERENALEPSSALETKQNITSIPMLLCQHIPKLQVIIG